MNSKSVKTRRPFLSFHGIWFLPVLTLLFLGCATFPREQQSKMQDTHQATRENEPYLAQWLKDLEICQNDLVQGNGERSRTLIRLAQTCCLLGELAPQDQRLYYYELGRSYAEMLVRECPDRADGHYWLGLSLCGIAEVGSAGRALRLLPEIVAVMEKAASIDPAIDQAGPHRVLGRIFSEAPPWPISVGDMDKSLQHLTLAVQIAPENSTNHLFLADTLMRLGKEKEAQTELDKVFQSTRHAVCPRGLEHDRQQARLLLTKLNNRH